MIFVTLIISQILHLQVIFSNFIENIIKSRISSVKVEQLFYKIEQLYRFFLFYLSDG